MKSGLSIAAAQPSCTVLDVRGNAEQHAHAIRRASARVVVFPEMSLTGYVLDAPAVDPSAAFLRPIVEACAETHSVALVGAPVQHGGERHIATLRVDGAGAVVAYRKCHLGDAERRAFSGGHGPATLTVDGWTLGMGICKDTGVDCHSRATAALGVDAYVAGLVHAPGEAGELHRRALRIAATCHAHVVFASFAGPAGPAYPATAGESTIWSRCGEVLARASNARGDVVRAVLGTSRRPTAVPATADPLASG